MYMVRYADDFVCLFQYENEAQRFYQLLIERLRKFGLEIAEDKSRILPLADTREQRNPLTFSALHTTMRQVTGASTVYCIEQAGRS